MMTQAQDVMSHNPVTCQKDDSVYQAVEVMRRRDTGVVPIVDRQGRCCGIVTDRDICLDVVLKKLDPKATRLEKIMHENLLTCRPQDDLKRVIGQMKQRQVKRILVMENDRCVGIISEHDIATQQGRHLVGELVAGVYG